MKDPDWQDVGRYQLPWHLLGNTALKVIGGEFTLAEETFRGPLQQLPGQGAVADISLKPGAESRLKQAEERTLLLYVYEGELILNGQTVSQQEMAKVTAESALQIRSETGAGALLLSGLPLKEPVAHYGPFVMNTQAEIDQAIQDYQQGTLTD